MRPNDLIWNYWVNNYLHGKDPPAFDILGWSVDATNLPSRLHSQFLEIFSRNVLDRERCARNPR
jgi:polyhydroxyalkanoate synthase